MYASHLLWQHTWNPKFTSAVGYSSVAIDNTPLALPGAFKVGQYILGNLLYSPVKNVTVGGELQWVSRENENGYNTDDVGVQFSFKYNFANTFGGGQ